MSRLNISIEEEIEKRKSLIRLERLYLVTLNFFFIVLLIMMAYYNYLMSGAILLIYVILVFIHQYIRKELYE